MESKLFQKKKYCCGCGACKNICPTKAIIMKSDNEGFQYPIINQSKCIDCGKCKQVCPIINSRSRTDEVVESLACYTKRDIRLDSSSGGLFTLFAEVILLKNGLVYGASFDENWSVHHIGIDKNEQLSLLRGSKYLQSRTENTFSEVRSKLEEGRMVLYTGTACQISGLKLFLEKEYDNLFLIDVLCHGVPSPLVWESFLNNLKDEYKSSIKNINFRNKDNGWKKYSVNIVFENNKKYQSSYLEDDYMKLFLSEICLRPSCYECKFKKLDRDSDITIGDCWGIEKYLPEMDDDMGTSAMFIHTNKGFQLFEMIQDSLVYKKCEKDRLVPPNADSRRSVIPHINRQKFFKSIIRKKEFNYSKKYLECNFFSKVKRKMLNCLRIVLQYNR